MKAIYNLYSKSKERFQDIEVEEIASCPMCHSAGHPYFEGGYIISNYDIDYIKLFIKTLIEYIVGENAFMQAQELIDTNQNS